MTSVQVRSNGNAVSGRCRWKTGENQWTTNRFGSARCCNVGYQSWGKWQACSDPRLMINVIKWSILLRLGTQRWFKKASWLWQPGLRQNNKCCMLAWFRKLHWWTDRGHLSPKKETSWAFLKIKTSSQLHTTLDIINIVIFWWLCNSCPYVNFFILYCFILFGGSEWLSNTELFITRA